MFSIVVASCLAVAGCSSTPQVAATAPAAIEIAQDAPAPVVDPSMTPALFLQTVAQSDAMEITLGKMAVTKADSPAVKDFGQRMATNHTAINVIIKKIAKADGIVLSKTLTSEDQALVARLTELNGVLFDKAYMSAMAEIHPSMLALFRWQYDNCKSESVKSFTAQTMPIIGTHTRVSEQLNAEVNKEEIRLAAEKKAAELKAKEVAKAQAAAEAAALAAEAAAKKNKRGGSRKGAIFAPAPAAAPEPTPTPAATPTPSTTPPSPPVG